MSITVAKGETIWSIAEDYCAGGDVRRLVYDIKSLNSLEDSFIYEGDTLIIPVR
ncbi:MAG: LysM peptidoglycan-binding domain-containing protein [Eubacteriales bacterium]|nr:LysM peptidoglycan-binding domain-containing protein [Eubacteriales bacterium]